MIFILDPKDMLTLDIGYGLHFLCIASWGDLGQAVLQEAGNTNQGGGSITYRQTPDKPALFAYKKISIYINNGQF